MTYAVTKKRLHPVFVSHLHAREDTKRGKTAKDSRGRLSPDGKWRSFPKVHNLLQYTSTGLYFARLKVNGKLIRRSNSHYVVAADVSRR